jgi:hypothetical protein
MGKKSHIFTERRVINLPSTEPYKKVESTVSVEPTSDTHIFRVYEGNTYIGSVGKNKSDKWEVFGAFVEEEFDTLEDGARALSARWIYQLARSLSKRMKA